MNENKTNINWYPGHMAKTKREIKEKLDLIDVVYEVIDARMPISSKIVDIDSLLKNKKKIIIMTKYDLCDTEITNKFIKYYENLGYKVITSDLKNSNISIIIKETENIMKEYNISRAQKGLKIRSTRILVVGVPNVGKSTLINKLAGKRKAGVGSRPGFTKQLSWIKLGNNLELLDSPGILWPKFEDQEVARTLASLSSIKEEILDTFDLSNYIIRKMYKLYKERLKDRYGIERLSDDLITEYDLIAKKRGALKKGGITDYDKVSMIIIRDLQNGYLGPVTFDRLEK